MEHHLPHIRGVHKIGAGSETIVELRLEAERLAPVAVSLQLFEPKGALLIGAYILAAMALPALVREIADVVCRIRKCGLVFDRRGDGGLRIKKSRELPGGTVLVVAKDGSTTLHNVCEGRVDLCAMTRATSTKA